MQDRAASGPGVRMRRLGDRVLRPRCARARRSMTPNRDSAREVRHRDVALDRQAAARAPAACDLPAGTRSARAPRRPASRCGPPCRESRSGRASTRIGADDRAREPGASGADEPGDPEDLAAAQHERRRRAAPPPPQAFDAQQLLAARVRAGADSDRLTSRSAISRTSSGTGHVGDVARRHVAAVAQHRDALADAEHLLHPVRDVDDGDAAARSDARSSRTAGRPRARSAPMSARPSRGCARRRTAPGRPRPSAAARDASVRTGASRIDRHAQRRRGFARASRRIVAQSTHAGPARRRLAEEDVLRDREVRHEAELLVDGADPEPSCPARICGDRPAGRRAESRRHRARTAPLRIFISVDLPAPFSPSSDVHLAGAHLERRRRPAPRRRDSACRCRASAGAAADPDGRRRWSWRSGECIRFERRHNEDTMPTTRRLTMAQAIVEFLTQQHTSLDGVEQPFFAGVSRFSATATSPASARRCSRRRTGCASISRGTSRRWCTPRSASPRWPTGGATLACTSSIGPGATNMITGAALATINRLPVLLLPGDIFATRGPAPVLQQLESAGIAGRVGQRLLQAGLAVLGSHQPPRAADHGAARSDARPDLAGRDRRGHALPAAGRADRGVRLSRRAVPQARLDDRAAAS